MLERASVTLLRVPSSLGAADSDEPALPRHLVLSVRDFALHCKDGALRKTIDLSGNNRDASILKVVLHGAVQCLQMPNHTPMDH